MFEFKRRTLGIGFGLLMMTILALGSAAAAFADGPTVGVNLGAGTFSEVSGSVTFTSPVTTLNGSDQVAIYSFPIAVTDATGSAAGWNLTITSTTFATTGGTVHSLDPSASTITGASINATGTNTGTAPLASTVLPVSYTNLVLPGASATAIRFFSAQANSGMGTSTITPTVHIAIPAATIAGNYSSIISVALVSTP